MLLVESRVFTIAHRIAMGVVPKLTLLILFLVAITIRTAAFVIPLPGLVLLSVVIAIPRVAIICTRLETSVCNATLIVTTRPGNVIALRVYGKIRSLVKG